MKDKYKILGILILSGFSFFYTYKVSSIIRSNDPIMNRINNIEDTLTISKIDPIINDDEYLTGINGCVVNKEESYNKMKEVNEFNEDLIVMMEDKITLDYNKYIVGGNKQNRKVSIILTDYSNDEINNFISDSDIKINYFIDGNNIKEDINKLMKLKGNIYNYGRNKKYLSKYILYDNTLLKTNFDSKSDYCLVTKKDKDAINLCSKYNMKTIYTNEIKEDILSYIKENLSNGKIFLINSNNFDEVKYSINYILSKGYKIVYLNELLDESNECKK